MINPDRLLATFLDLVPMAIGLGRGSEANVPLARAVVGGLLTSTFLTLIVVPILYTIMNRDRTEPEIDIDKELEAPVLPPVHARPGGAAVLIAQDGVVAEAGSPYDGNAANTPASANDGPGPFRE